MVAASFWLGMKWRRAHAPAAWSSIIFTSLFFYILPLLIPMLFTGLKNDPHLLKTTNPAPVQRAYQAKIVDIEAREQEIEKWACKLLLRIGNFTSFCFFRLGKESELSLGVE